MTPLIQLTIFLADAFVAVWTAWQLVCWLAPHSRSLLERTLAWVLAGFTLVAGAGVLLGATGGLGQPGFLLVHAAGLALLGAARRSQWRDDWAALRQLARDIGQVVMMPGVEAWLAGLLMVTAVALMALAFASHPVVFDALSYRLPRVGQWLQDGRITVITTDDARLNYMPVVPDLVMAWFLTIMPAGYKAAAVAQALGGILALGATMGLARLTGLGRSAAMGAAGLFLGLANVAPQFTSVYTDLFTAGVLAAAFYMWLAALQRGEGSWLGGVGAGLALGAKGTVVYFVPGLLLVVGWLAWRHRASRAAWTQTLVGGILAVAVFVLPVLVRNARAYGGVLGPENFVVWHHGKTPDLRGSEEKLRLNLTSSFAQLCEPNSQPPWWRSATTAMGAAVIRQLPEQDPYAFDELNRRANLEKIYAVAAPDADVSSTGVLLPGLGLVAVMVAWRRRRTPDGELALVWAAAIAAFVLFMHWRVQWHPYLFRFVVLIAPWLAVLVAWWLGTLPRLLCVAAWTLVAAASVHGFGAAMFDTYQSGWPAVTRPGQSVGFHLYQNWRDWSAGLDRPAEPLRLALPMNLPLAAFYRQQPIRLVAPRRLSALASDRASEAVHVDEGWLIVPAAKFIGREGPVMGRTWLYEGDEHHAFSLAAYRALGAGERPVPMLYRNRLTGTDTTRRHELLVRTWDSEPVQLELINTGGTAATFTLGTPLGGTTGVLPPGARLRVEVPLPADVVSLITVDIPKAVAGTVVPAALDVRLVP